MGKSYKERGERAIEMLVQYEAKCGADAKKIDTDAADTVFDFAREALATALAIGFPLTLEALKGTATQWGQSVLFEQDTNKSEDHLRAGGMLYREMKRIEWECFLAPEPTPEVTVNNVANAMAAIASKEGEAAILKIIRGDINSDRRFQRHRNQIAHNRMMDNTLEPESSPPGGTLWREIAEGLLADAVEFVTTIRAGTPGQVDSKEYFTKRSKKYGRPAWMNALSMVRSVVHSETGGRDTTLHEEGISDQAPATPEALEKYAKGGMVDPGIQFVVGEAPPEIAMSLADKLTSIWEGPEVPLADLFRAIDAADLSEIAKFEEVCRKCDPCVWPEAEAEYGMTGSVEWHDLNERMAEKFGPRVWAVVKRCVALQRVLGRAPKGDS